MTLCFFFCFFFQAEDGIRDGRVTGVQTCALPISRRPIRSAGAAARSSPGSPSNPSRRTGGHSTRSPTANAVAARLVAYDRSEERRVGKECRSRWSPDQEQTKTNAAQRKRERRERP